MALDPNIILQAGNFKTPDYATTLAQVANLKAAGQTAKLRDLQITGAQRENEQQAQNAQIDSVLKAHSAIGQILGGVTDQASFDAAKSEIGRNPALAQTVDVSQLPQVYDEAGAAKIQNLVRQGQTVGEQLQQKKLQYDRTTDDYAQLDAGSDAIQKAQDQSFTIPKYEAGIAQAGAKAGAEANARMPAEIAVAKAKADATAGTTIPADSAVVQSWVKNVLGGNATMQQVPAPLRNSVSMAITDAPKEAYSPLAASRFSTASNRITANFIKLPQYELTANGLPYLQRIDAALKTPGSVSDQDLLDSLTKLNTAGNAITDAQVKIITDGKSLSDWAGTVANKFKNGGVLSENQRTQIQEIAKNIYANYKKGYQPVYDQVTKQLKASGIPEPFWSLPDLNNLSAQAGLGADAPPATESKVIGGVTYHKVTGQWMQ